MDAILIQEGALTRQQKEYIFLVCSGANLSTYCVTAHCEIVRMLGIQGPEPEQVAVNHASTALPESDKALLDFALKLNNHPAQVARQDMEALRAQGFGDPQILEAVLVVGLAKFANFVAFGLGTAPDFDPSKVVLSQRSFLGQEANLLAREDRPTDSAPGSGTGEDADAEVVARVKAGDLNAFEELVRRHSRRIYRTLVGILGEREEAKDAVQDAFLKAFQHLGEFQGRAKFSTWLVRIASNTGIERLRERKRLESLEEISLEPEAGFRPAQTQAWNDDPERVYSRAEVRKLMEKELMQLPAPYRTVVVLRDIEQLSTEDAAAALGLGIPALKSRLLRGRLMLREALSPYFARSAKRRTA